MTAKNRTESGWAFPPALDLDFVAAYSNVSSYKSNETWHDETWRGITGLLSDVVTNLTVAERFAKGYPKSGFGSNDALVRVGDAIEVDFKHTSSATMMLTCSVCTPGAEGGLVENACDNYTRLANSYSKPDYPPPLAAHSDYIIPSLEGFFPLENPDRTCALCTISLFTDVGYFDTDFTVPFPVLQQSAYPHKRFSAEHPTGTEDASISDGTTSPLSAPIPDDNGSKINVGMVVGVVLGVLTGCILLVLLYWWLWKKRKGRTKVMDSGASSTAEPEGRGVNRSVQDIALQRIQGVVRRPNTSASEVPPPYHEAVQRANPP